MGKSYQIPSDNKPGQRRQFALTPPAWVSLFFPAFSHSFFSPYTNLYFRSFSPPFALNTQSVHVIPLQGFSTPFRSMCGLCIAFGCIRFQPMVNNLALGLSRHWTAGENSFPRKFYYTSWIFSILAVCSERDGRVRRRLSISIIPLQRPMEEGGKRVEVDHNSLRMSLPWLMPVGFLSFLSDLEWLRVTGYTYRRAHYDYKIDIYVYND